MLAYEPLVRLGCFLSVLALMGIWESLAPLRARTQRKASRWANNLGLLVLNSVVARLIPAFSAVAAAEFCAHRGWGLFNFLSLPTWAAGILSFLLFDLAIYLQHVMFHAVPALWRLHMVHHADLDFDASTGVRFHTIEILMSMTWKAALVLVLGPPAWAVVAFEVALNATSLFNHGNVRFPGWLDRVLRLFIVTPDMHRVHHSVIANETNSNFGFNLPWWDYLLGTYRSQPEAGHRDMAIGLTQFRDRRVERLHWMLALPFLGKPGAYPINRRATERADVGTASNAQRRAG